MKEVPNKLHCAYCIRNRTHGGECTSQRSHYDEQGCLIFKADEKGCIRNADFKIPIPLYGEIPLIDVWNNNYEIGGVDTEIRIRRIHGLSWNNKRGLLYVHCNCDYYINEFHDNYVERKERPDLKVIK